MGVCHPLQGGGQGEKTWGTGRGREGLFLGYSCCYSSISCTQAAAASWLDSLGANPGAQVMPSTHTSIWVQGCNCCDPDSQEALPHLLPAPPDTLLGAELLLAWQRLLEA